MSLFYWTALAVFVLAIAFTALSGFAATWYAGRFHEDRTKYWRMASRAAGFTGAFFWVFLGVVGHLILDDDLALWTALVLAASGIWIVCAFAAAILSGNPLLKRPRRSFAPLPRPRG